MIKNINPSFGDSIEFASTSEMETAILECGYALPPDGLVEGRDYSTVEWTDDRIWAECFGTAQTCETALALADAADRTPQDYAAECIREAIERGADFDRATAMKSLCHQLGVSVS